MEEKHQQLIPPFNSPNPAQNSEITIAMSSSIEENIRKLYEAAKKGCIQTLKTLIQEDPYLIQKALIIVSTSFIDSPLLHESVSHGHLDFTRLLLDHNSELAVEVDALQRTPLHLASENGDVEIVRALLEKNTSACLVRDHNGFIPLHYAAMNGKIEIMQLLISARPQSVLMKLNNSQTVLHLCVQGNHLEPIKLLTEIVANRDKDFLNTADDAGNTILDLSLMLRQIEIVGHLLSIPEVKTRTSTIIAKKKSSESKKRKRRKAKRQRRECASQSSKMKIGWWSKLGRNLKYKGDWVQEVQGTMMLVATVIATVTFQAGVNPPGGVWQQDTLFNCSSSYKNSLTSFNSNLYDIFFCHCRDTTFFPAGTAIMSYQQEMRFWVYLWINTVSFLASTSVILLIVSRFPLKNRICSWLLALAMCIAVVSLAMGYLMGIQMVTLMSFNSFSSWRIFSLTVMSWLGVVGVVCLWLLSRSLWWVVKTLLRSFTSKLKSHSFNRTHTWKINSTSFCSSLCHPPLA